MLTVRSTFGVLVLCAMALSAESAEAAPPAERLAVAVSGREVHLVARFPAVAVDEPSAFGAEVFAERVVAAGPVLSLRGSAPSSGARARLNPKYRDWTVAELREERRAVTLGGPVSLIVVGATLSVVGGVSTLITIGLSAYMFGQEDAFPILLVASTTGAGVSMGMLGAFALGQRIHERDELLREIQLREGGESRGRKQTGLSLSHGPLAVPVGFGWGMQGAF